MRLLFSTIIGLVMFCGQVCAQQSITCFKRFGRAEGVPNTSNNKIFESSDHFLWLGTSSGLYRFDGYQFSPYFSNNKDSTTISSNVIADIEEDRNGFLWVATFGRGVNKLNRKTGKWKRYLHPTKDENPFYWVFDLFKDKQGRLWLGTSGRGLLLYNEQADNFQQFIPDTSKSKIGVIRFENEVRAITADVKNREILWLAGTDGLYRFDTKRSSFEHYENLKNGQAAWINNSFHCVYAQDEGNIWMGAWGGGLVHFNTRTGLFTNHPPAPQEYAKQNLSRNIIHSIAYCNDSLLYVTTANQGLLTFNIHTRLFTTISKTAEPDDAGVSTPFNAITHTSDGSTWICSEENIFQKNAVYQRMGAFQSFYQPAQKYVYKPGLSGLLYNKNTRQYWMSCNSGYGVYIYDSNFNYLKSIPIEGFAADRRLRDIVRDAAGNTWLLSKDFPYLYYYDATKDQFLNAAPKFNNPSFISSGLQEMAADGKGNVWLANKNELFKYDALTTQLKKIDLSTALKGQKEWLWVKIRFDQNNEPWLATNTGLYHYHEREGKWEIFYAQQNNYQSLASSSVVDIAFDKKGHCWMAPMDEGLQLYDLTEKKFTSHYTQATGFLSQRVNEITTDSNGDLWAATIDGLVRYDAKNSNWYSFNQDDGLPSGYLDLLFAMDDGSMVLSTGEGFIHFNIHDLPVNKQKPVVYFNRFTAGGRDFELRDSSIYLPYTSNALNIEFGAITTVMGNRTSFYYKILPQQKEWLITTQRSISLAGFAPGIYTLAIKAVNSDGVESDVKKFAISVAYPFWQQWWFIILTVILVTGLVYFIYRYRVRQLLKMQQMRNHISRDLHDEIGSSVSSVNILSMLAKKQLGIQHPVTPLLTQIEQSAQNAGESINEIIWSINPKNDSIERIVLRMKELASEMLELYQINYQLNFDSQLNHLAIPMQDRRHLFMIYKEALNNMIKYSDCKNASLSMLIVNRSLELKIEDDGIGFDPANHKPGNGLMNMQERAKEMKGTLEINASHGNGCSILLHYPLKK